MSVNVKAFFYSSSPAKQIFALPVTSQWGNGRVCLERRSIGNKKKKPVTKKEVKEGWAPHFKRNPERRTFCLPLRLAHHWPLPQATGNWLPVRLPATFQSFSGRLAQQTLESKSNGANERYETLGGNGRHSLAARTYSIKILAF